MLAERVNGDPGTLCDLSLSGYQIFSHSALKSNQIVKVQLSSHPLSVRCTGKVAWTRLEPATKGQPLSYRAGVRFTEKDEAAIESFATHHGVST